MTQQAYWLTRRQAEIVRLEAQGFTAEEAAAHLHVQRRTVITHRTKLFEKFGVREARKLPAACVRSGLMTADQLFLEVPRGA